MKNLNDISYESTEPILMKFHIKHLCDIYIQYQAKMGHDSKFKMATMPIYGKNIQMTSSPEPPGRLG